MNDDLFDVATMTRELLRVLHYNELLVKGLARRHAPVGQILDAVAAKRLTHYERARRAIIAEDARAWRVRVAYAACETMILPVLRGAGEGTR